MPEDNAVTRWISGVKRGEPDAARELWRCYFEKLVRIARRKLERCPRRIADEEDVALSAFKSFCLAARQGRFPDLADRASLWRLLIRLTARKAVDLIRYNQYKKRRVLGESALHLRGEDEGTDGQVMARVLGDTPTPEFAAMLAEEYRRLLERLGDPRLTEIAVAKMEGYTNQEIAEKTGASLRSVERQLQLIRRKWKEPAQ